MQKRVQAWLVGNTREFCSPLCRLHRASGGPDVDSGHPSHWLVPTATELAPTLATAELAPTQTAVELARTLTAAELARTRVTTQLACTPAAGSSPARRSRWSSSARRPRRVSNALRDSKVEAAAGASFRAAEWEARPCAEREKR
jgi:hypothetical protein